MAANEALTLDGLALGDEVTFRLEALDMTPPPEAEEWVKGADSNGAILAREPLCENRVIEARVRVMPQTTKDLALAKIALIVDKLKEAQRNANGVALTWVPADATLPALTFRCLSGQVTGMPIDVETGWMAKAPLLTVRMTCLPFGEGTETLLGTVTSTLPLVTLEVSGVKGDVSALGRIVADPAAVAMRHLEWGLESRWYTFASPPSLILDSDSLVPSAASAGATRTGAYDPGAVGNNVIRATLAAQPLIVCTTGNQSHIGSFRAKARVWTNAVSAGTVYMRLTFQSGDGPWRSLAYATVPVFSNWAEVDLGMFTISPAELGTQRWQGRIEAFSSVVDDTLDVDMIELIPAELYGVARATYAYSPGALVARDEWTATTATAALNARVAPTGGTWATSGTATGDFVAADGPATGDETMRRTSTSDTGQGRYAVLGATNYTNVEVGVDVYHSGPPAAYAGLEWRPGVIARWVDASNFVRAWFADDSGTTLSIERVVAGASVTLATVSGTSFNEATWYRLRLVVYSSGRAIATLLDRASGAVIAIADGTNTSLATAGTLATGKPGFTDWYSGAAVSTRSYDNFYTAQPPEESVVINSGQSISVGSSATLREDATGVYWGQPPSYVGSRFTVPPAGGAGRRARIAVKARRNDVAVAADDNIADSMTVAVYATPRYLVVPRA